MKDNRDIAAFLMQPEWRAGREYNQEERERLEAEIAKKIENDRLHIALAAFPFKMPNRLKTEGYMPDWGERVALERLKRISECGGELGYEIIWNIITDGSYYAEELFVFPGEVTVYGRRVREMAKELNISAEFIELKDIVQPKIQQQVHGMSYENEKDREFVLRTAGIMYARDKKERLEQLFHETKDVKTAIISLVEEDADFRARAEASAAQYQLLKAAMEEQKIFAQVFPNAGRASIQINPNRNLQGQEIERPLAIRITDNKYKNLFPWLGVACEAKARYNAYVAEVQASGKQRMERQGLHYYQ